MQFSSQFATVVSLVVCSTAQAGTVIFVDDDNCPGPGSGTLGDPYCTIQSAIDDAVNGDEIVVADGLYTGPGSRDLDFGGRLITLRSESGPGNCIIDCQNAGRGFLFTHGETSDAVVEGLTIRDGFADQASPLGARGAGMYIDNSSPTVRDCVFSSNCACNDNFAPGRGGALYVIGGSPLIDRCSFISNRAGGIGSFQGFGGGIYSAGSTTLAGCEFLGNSAFGHCQGFGGAIYRSGAEHVTDCVFSGNGAASGACGGGAAAAGGAVYSNAALIGWFVNCVFTQNHVNGSGSGGARGGAIAAQTYPVASAGEIVINCAFIDNSTAGPTAVSAGAMEGNQTAINCTFIGNSAAHPFGYSSIGAVYTSGVLVNCTFSGNTADLPPGGVLTGSAATLINCILWGNSPNELTGTGSVTYSDVQGGWPGIGNIDADPMFVDPGNGDFRLSPGSPCIDAGDSAPFPEGCGDCNEPDPGGMPGCNDLVCQSIICESVLPSCCSAAWDVVCALVADLLCDCTGEEADTDLDGNPRRLDVPETPDTGAGDAPIVDMGAYESLGGGCLALTSQDVVCHPDGSTFTLEVEGVSACTGGPVMANFTGSGGAVGEDLCFTMMVTQEQGGFCCSTQVCAPVPDCSEATADLDGDGVVGVLDLMLLLAEFGACQGGCWADMDHDGAVGVTDLLVLLSNWD